MMRLGTGWRPRVASIFLSSVVVLGALTAPTAASGYHGSPARLTSLQPHANRQVDAGAQQAGLKQGALPVYRHNSISNQGADGGFTDSTRSVEISWMRLDLYRCAILDVICWGLRVDLIGDFDSGSHVLECVVDGNRIWREEQWWPFGPTDCGGFFRQGTWGGSTPSQTYKTAYVIVDSTMSNVLRSDAYSDIDDIGVHRRGVQALAAEGVFEGTECAPGRFCPREPLPRWIMVVWLVRILDGADPQSAPDAGFADVDPGQWWAPHVNRLFELGVTKGCRTDPLRYCPSRAVNRAQMASFLARAFSLPPGPPAGFADVDPQGVHSANIDALATAGITVGCRTDPGEWREGTSPSRSLRTVRDSLPSYGSHSSAWG